MSETLYYLFCTETEEAILNDESLEYLENPDCEISPTFWAVNIGNKEDVVEAVYKASKYGGYFMLSKEEYHRYNRIK